MNSPEPLNDIFRTFFVVVVGLNKFRANWYWKLKFGVQILHHLRLLFGTISKYLDLDLLGFVPLSCRAYQSFVVFCLPYTFLAR